MACLASALGAQSHGGLVSVDALAGLPRTDADLCALPQAHMLASADWIYLDTETSGLSGGVGNLAFMLGLARRTAAGSLEVRQFVLGRFDAERALLEALVEWLTPGSVLVSYNGKCFDVPLLQARLRLHRIDRDLSRLPHLDLMYPVRRAFRRHWPDCRLQTAERRLLDLQRVDDLPGAEAPAAWQRWLRDGATRPLAGVLRHNAQDVVSLALLHQRLVDVYAGAAATAVDHTAVGCAWREAGDERRALSIWEQAGGELDDTGRLALAAGYRRAGRWSAAAALWGQLFASGNRDAASALSKYHEHRRRDIGMAIRYAAYCEPGERSVRLARLQLKQARGPQLSLWPPVDGKRDVVTGRV